MGSDHHALSRASQVVAAGREPRSPGAQVGAPLVLTSTYIADGITSYGRFDNPTWAALESVVGELEGGTAITYASGMGAVSAALSFLPHHGRIVVPHSAYSGTLAALADRAGSGSAVVSPVDITSTTSVTDALDGADMLWLESPTNPLLDVADLPELIKAARSRGVLVVVDNTLATPLLQRPLELGAEIVIHSATKYLAGHSDVLLGIAVAASDAEPTLEALRHHRTIHGAIPGPMESWLALRGIRTLAVRFDRACANAAALADRLSEHPRVERMRYPGSGAMISIEVAPAAGEDPGRAAEEVAARTALWVHSTSLGGVESQIERRRRHEAEPSVVPDNLLRLSVGIEDVDDLWRDLNAALTGD